MAILDAGQTGAADDAAFRQLQALVHRSSDVVVVLDAAFGIRQASTAVEQCLGRLPTSLVGHCALDLVHPDDVSAAAAGLARTSHGPPVEMRLRHADGRWIPVEAAVHTEIADPDVGGMVVTLRDVTDRRVVEETLRSERRFLRAILHELEDGIAAYGPQGELRMINRAARRFFGMADRNVPPEEWGDQYRMYDADGVTPVDDRDTPVQQALRGDRIRAREVVVVPRNAPPRTLLISGLPIFDPEGTFVGAVAAMHDVTHRREAEARLEHLALHDALTGLPNRLLLRDRLERALTRGSDAGDTAVLFLDVDRFKVVNDSLGHSAGDQLLCELGARLCESVRGLDTVARLGGDEFVVLSEGVSGAREATDLAERISSRLASPFQLDSHEVRVTASIGIAIAPPGLHGSADKAAEALLRDADAAMYRAKDLGRARVEVFDEATRVDALHRLEVEQRLALAVDEGWLQALYQPIFDVETGALTGVEALVRCHDPDQGLVLPETFLPVAEDTGLITRIDTWMLHRACEDARRWRDAVPGHELRVAVNASARQLARRDLDAVIDEALRAANLPPDVLVIEITETAIAEATPEAIATMQRLRAMGVHMAADDFGTGYSSLAHLKRFPVDVLKIDRSFVDGLAAGGDDATIVAAVIGLGHALGLEVVAEGVEAAEQLDRLRALGCDHYQGFLSARPCDAATIMSLLRRSRVRATG